MKRPTTEFRLDFDALRKGGIVRWIPAAASSAALAVSAATEKRGR
jgi:hypothetical protein